MYDVFNDIYIPLETNKSKKYKLHYVLENYIDIEPFTPLMWNKKSIIFFEKNDK